jgi:hypothetical protein
MRQVVTNLELAQLQEAKRGFILNARHVKRLHRAGCETVGAMVSTAYPKIFFEEFDEAQQWADKEYGAYPTGWTTCGICRPRERPASPNI